MDISWWLGSVCWVLLATAIRTQQEFASNFQPNHHNDRAKLLKLAVICSAVLATVVSVGLVYLHYSVLGVAWTIALCVCGGFLAAVLWGALSALLDDLLLALASFGVWPASALGFYLLSGVAVR